MGVEREKYKSSKEQEKERKEHRRANNEGAVSQRKSDGRWQGEVVTGINSKGKKIKKYVYAKTKEDCLAKVLDLTYEVRNKTYFEPSKIKLAEWLNTWLNTYRKNKLKLTTYGSYETNIRVHIAPAFSNIFLKDITLNKVQEFLNAKYEEGLSNATVQKIYAILNSALRKAILLELILRNPMIGIELRNKDVGAETDEDLTEGEVSIFTKEEQNKFQNSVKGIRYASLFMTALFSGLRIGELTALRWSLVDLDNGKIHVRRTAVRVTTYENTGGKKTRISIQTPKTKASIRTVPIPPSLVEILKNHKASQIEEVRKRLNKGQPFNDQGYVFMAPNGNIVDNRNVMRTFYNILSKNNLPDYNLHSLRHTYASRLLEKKYSLKHISELLGHKDVAFTTRTYVHVLPEELRKSVDSLEDLF